MYFGEKCWTTTTIKYNSYISLIKCQMTWKAFCRLNGAGTSICVSITGVCSLLAVVGKVSRLWILSTCVGQTLSSLVVWTYSISCPALLVDWLRTPSPITPTMGTVSARSSGGGLLLWALAMSASFCCWSSLTEGTVAGGIFSLL